MSFHKLTSIVVLTAITISFNTLAIEGGTIETGLKKELNSVCIMPLSTQKLTNLNILLANSANQKPPAPLNLLANSANQKPPTTSTLLTNSANQKPPTMSTLLANSANQKPPTTPTLLANSANQKPPMLFTATIQKTNPTFA